MAESAIIIAVPEAEPFVGKLRAQFDSAAKLGVPAHITVLYPFMPPERFTQRTFEGLRRAISGVQPFDFRLTTVGRFPGVVYLAPECSGPFVELVGMIARWFPEFPRTAANSSRSSHTSPFPMAANCKLTWRKFSFWH